VFCQLLQHKDFKPKIKDIQKKETYVGERARSFAKIIRRHRIFKKKIADLNE
jgi:hypothetical protein